jgi:hypothetical protein
MSIMLDNVHEVNFYPLIAIRDMIMVVDACINEAPLVI